MCSSTCILAWIYSPGMLKDHVWRLRFGACLMHAIDTVCGECAGKTLRR